MAINMTIITLTMTNNVIDIHSHLIYGVDDGAKTLEDSINSLKIIKEIGLTKVICTPHITHGNLTRIKKIKEHYLQLYKIARQEGIELLLGNEILLTSETFDLLKRKRLRALDGKKYILVEFLRRENMEIGKAIELIEDIIDLGYQPILAHPELYWNYSSVKKIRKFKEVGILLQLDASSVLKKHTTRRIYKLSHRLLKKHLIDFVASDNHSNAERNYYVFKKAYQKILKKYGYEYTEILFNTNPNEILK